MRFENVKNRLAIHSEEEELASFAHYMQTGKLPSDIQYPPEFILSYMMQQDEEAEDEEGNVSLALPVDPYEIIENMPSGTIEVAKGNFNISGMRGASGRNRTFDPNESDEQIKFMLNANENESTQRYLLAHMLGHYFLGHYTRFTRLVETKDTLDIGNEASDCERAANIWACDLLVPAEALQTAFDNHTPISELIDMFNAPAAVLTQQAKKLGRKLPIFGVVELRGASGEHANVNYLG